MGQFDNDRTVILLTHRLQRLGIALDRYLGVITNVWSDVPSGFGFTCRDRAVYDALMSALVQNLNFGADSMIGGSQHVGASFREVSTTDGLHIVLSSRPDPVNKSTCSIHLDSVAPVTGRDKNGMIIYDVSKVLQHLATDLKRTPRIVPGGQQGLVFGFRF